MRTAEHVSTFSQFWPVLLTRISTIWSASPEQSTTGKNFPVDAPDLGSSLGPRCNTTADVQASNPRKSHPDATVPVRHAMAHVGSLGQHLPTPPASNTKRHVYQLQGQRQPHSHPGTKSKT